MRKEHHALGAALLASLTALLAGCASGEIQPAVPIDDHRSLAIVPFRDMDFEEGESPLGHDLAKRVAKRLEGNADFKLVPQEDVEALLSERRKGRLSDQEIVRRTGASYVLRGHVRGWQLRDPGSVNVRAGSARIDVSVFETPEAARERLGKSARLGRFALERDVRARFEPDVFGPRDATEDDVDDGLRNAASRKLAWIFLSHTKEEEEELASSRGWTGQ